MSIVPRRFSTDEEENRRLFRRKLLELVGSVEGFEPEVYSDSMGVPTIGYGYALIVRGASTWNARERSEINRHLPEGLEISKDEYEVLEEIARDVLNNPSVKDEEKKEKAEEILFDKDGDNRISLNLTKEQAEQLFENIAREYINYGVRNKFEQVTGSHDFFNYLDYSKEMIALASIIYQGPIYVRGNDTLVNAIISGDRARAWFEIRYFSNNLKNETNRRGWGHRKCKEAQIFGLYQDEKNITQREAQRFLNLLNTRIFADRSTYTDSQINRTGLKYDELKDMTALDYIRYYERVTRIDPTCDYAGRSRKIDDIIAEAQKKAYGMVLYALSDTEEDLLKRFYNKKEWEDETEKGEYIIYTVKSGDSASSIANKFLDCSYTYLRKIDSNGNLTDKGLDRLQVGSNLYLPVEYIKDDYNNNTYIKKEKEGYELREDWSNYKFASEIVKPRKYQPDLPSYNCQELSNDLLEKAINTEHDKIFIPGNDQVFEELAVKFKNDYNNDYIKYLTDMTGKQVEPALLDDPFAEDGDWLQIENQELIEKLLADFDEYLSDYIRKLRKTDDSNGGEKIYFSRQSNFDDFRSLDGVITIYDIFSYIIYECYNILPEDEFLQAINSIFNLSPDDWEHVSSWVNTDTGQDGSTILDIVSLITISCRKVSDGDEGPDSEVFKTSLGILNALLSGINYDNLDYRIQQMHTKGKVNMLLSKYFENIYHNYFYEYTDRNLPLDKVPPLKEKENRGNIAGFAENLLVRYIEVQAGCKADSLVNNIIRWYHRCSKLTVTSKKGFYNALISNFKATGLRIFPVLDNLDVGSKWQKPVIERLNDFLDPDNDSYDDLMECLDIDYDEYLANNFDSSLHEGIKNSDKELKEGLAKKYKDYANIVSFIESIDEEEVELIAVDLLDKESIIRKIALNNLNRTEEIA